jgi:hypothetical protein
LIQFIIVQYVSVDTTYKWYQQIHIVQL